MCHVTHMNVSCHTHAVPTRCSPVQPAATHCNTRNTRPISGAKFDHAPHCNTWLKSAATHYNTLQHTATHCNTLQHTATHCNALQHTATPNHAPVKTLQHTATHCNTLQHTATPNHAPVKPLQHTATHCNTLQQLTTHL